MTINVRLCALTVLMVGLIVVQNEQCNAVKLGSADDYEFAIQITKDTTTMPDD